MEIIQEIGSYAGLAAVLGLAVLSALYFSQARDVKRLREWAGRAPERTEAPQPSGVVAKPVPKPPVPKPPAAKPAVPGAKPAVPGAKPAVPGAKPVPAATPSVPAAASAAGAAPAVASGPAAATPAGASAAPKTEDDEEATESSNGTDEQGVVSQDTVVHPPPTPLEEDEDAEGDEPPSGEEGDADREPRPEDYHEDVDDDDLDTGDSPAVPAPPAPPPPRRPTVAIGSRTEPILPPYKDIRPGGAVAGDGGHGVFSSPRRAVAVVGGSLLALLAIGFGVLQLTGDDDSEPASQPAESAAQEESQEDKPDGGSKTPSVDPAKVRVAVLNGTTVPGLAAQIGDSIERQGFQLGTVTNFIDQQRAESVVKFAPGSEREAAEVGRRLKISQREPMDAETQGIAGDAAVAVIAGADKTQ